MQFHKFALTEDAFARACDERFTFHSSSFHGACARILRHLDAGDSGVLLIGSPGSGKTTLLRHLAGRLADRGWSVLWHDPRSGPLPETGRGTPRVVLVDNADDLPDDILVDICWAAADARTARGAMLVAGTEALLEPLVNAAFGRDLPLVRLPPLPHDEVAAYVQHRLKVAGAAGEDLFTPPALALLAECSRGVPGTVNRLSVTALLLAELEGRDRVDDRLLCEAASDLGIADIIGRKISERSDGEYGVDVSSSESRVALPASDTSISARSSGPAAGIRRRRLSAAVAASMAAAVAVAVIWMLGKPQPLSGVADRTVAVTTIAAAESPARGNVAGGQAESADGGQYPLPAPQDGGSAGNFAPVPIVSSSDDEAVQPAEAAPVVPSVPAAELAASIRRGDDLLGLGDIAAARLCYDFAMQRGSAEAARKLAQTYDPMFLQNAGVSGLRSDQDKAVAMYRTAAGMGDGESALRIAALTGPAAADMRE